MSQSTLQANLELLQGQIRDLSAAMRAAKVQAASTNPQVAADGRLALSLFRTQYLAALERIAALRRQASAEDAPSDFMLALSNFSDSALATARDVGAIVQKLPDVAGKVANALPWILGALLLFAVLYFVATLRKEA